MASTQELPSDISNQLPCEWNGASGLGPRKENQDVAALAIKDDPRLHERGVALVVCDGVGGEVGGQAAARIAAQATLEYYYNHTPTEVSDPAEAALGAMTDDTTTLLEGAVRQAHQKVKAESAATPAHAHMATTIVVAAVRNGTLYTTHVGDSRAYLLHANGTLEQVTRDHSWVAEQVAAGVLTEEEARQSAMRVVVTRSLGSAANNTPESNKRLLQEGDRVLLCSDGLHGTLTDDKMAEILRAHRNPHDAAKALVNAALPSTTDNTTAVVLNYGQVTQSSKDERQKRVSLALVIGGLLAALAGVIALLLWMRNNPAGSGTTGNVTVGPATQVLEVSAALVASPVAPTAAPTDATAPAATAVATTGGVGPTSTLIPTLVATATTLPLVTLPTPRAAATATRAGARASATATATISIAATATPTATLSTINLLVSTKAPTPAPTANPDDNLLVLSPTATPNTNSAATPTRTPTRTLPAPPALPRPARP
ncbi:MAG: protein phosphatase 2C domain-containing protein [Anaerolineae bacterium]|nr:protein phosphatase 2C domain-containing protein [Anaerolineae bacterium]